MEPKLNVIFRVSAYDEGGYGDDRSQEFTNGVDAVKYAESLDSRFRPIVTKIISMSTIYVRIWPPQPSE